MHITITRTVQATKIWTKLCVCVCFYLSACLPRFVCLSLSFSVLHVNWPSIVWLIKMSSAAPSSLRSHSLHLPHCNLLIAIYTDLPLPYRVSACLPGLSHVPCTFAPCSNYLYFLSTTCFCSASRKFQSETCAALFCFFFFLCFGLALISDQG